MQNPDLKWMIPFLGYFVACIAGGFFYIAYGLNGVMLIGVGIVGLVLVGLFLTREDKAEKGTIGFVSSFASIGGVFSWIVNLPWNYEPIYDVAMVFVAWGMICFLLGFLVAYLNGTIYYSKD